jgi:hypothetical protein
MHACNGKSSEAGLPEGLFSNQNSRFGSILESLRLENVDIFHGQLEYLMAFCCDDFIYYFRLFQTILFYDNWVHFVFIWYIFSGFGLMNQEKSGNPVPKKPNETYVFEATT